MDLEGSRILDLVDRIVEELKVADDEVHKSERVRLLSNVKLIERKYTAFRHFFRIDNDRALLQFLSTDKFNYTSGIIFVNEKSSFLIEKADLKNKVLARCQVNFVSL